MCTFQLQAFYLVDLRIFAKNSCPSKVYINLTLFSFSVLAMEMFCPLYDLNFTKNEIKKTTLALLTLNIL